MSKLTVLAGDFAKGTGSATSSGFTMPWKPGDGFFGETVLMRNLQSVELATEESVKRIGGTIGWGAVGATLLGPVGLLAGLLVGGRGKEVTFVAVTKDGRKFLATADAAIYKKALAAVF